MDNVLNLESENKNIYLSPSKVNSVGQITSFYKVNSQIKGLAMIKRKYLEIENSFYSEIFGSIKIKKSVGSIFL